MIRILWICMFVMVGTASAHARNYGAIAYSPSSGADGYSYDYGSRAQAERRALSECRVRGGGCRVAVWFVDACGALAIGNGGGWGSGWGTSRQRAQYEAIQVCRRHTNGCRIKRWVCNSR